MVVAFLEQVRAATYKAAADGTPRLPVTFLLDEVANVAPLPDLPAMVSEGGGQGLLSMACLQDLSQARGRWGRAAEGFFSLFGTKVLLPGIGDLETLEVVSRLAGQGEVVVRSVSGSAWWGPAPQRPRRTPRAAKPGYQSTRCTAFRRARRWSSAAPARPNWSPSPDGTTTRPSGRRHLPVGRPAPAARAMSCRPLPWRASLLLPRRQRPHRPASPAASSGGGCPASGRSTLPHRGFERAPIGCLCCWVCFARPRPCAAELRHPGSAPLSAMMPAAG